MANTGLIPLIFLGYSKGDPGRKWKTFTCTFWDAVRGTPGEFAPCRPLLCDRKYRYMCPVFARFSPHCFPKNIVACVPGSPVSPLTVSQKYRDR